jgi:RNA polymerase sigma-70 factor (family 1)
VKSELYNEDAVLLLMAQGDEDAFRRLYDHYRKKVYYVAREMLRDDDQAADVLQEVFIKLWQHREKLPDILNFNAWLNTVTRHEILMVFRKMAREDQLLRELASLKPPAEGTQDPMALKELRTALHSAMDKLTPQQRRVFELSRMEGLRHAEIAHLLGISRQAVKKHMTDALRVIRRELI